MINISQSALTRSQIKKFVLPYKTRENKKEEETEKVKWEINTEENKELE